MGFQLNELKLNSNIVIIPMMAMPVAEVVPLPEDPVLPLVSIHLRPRRLVLSPSKSSENYMNGGLFRILCMKKSHRNLLSLLVKLPDVMGKMELLPPKTRKTVGKYVDAV